MTILTFKQIVTELFPTKLLLNKANSVDNVDLYLSISNDIVSSKIDHKDVDYNFENIIFYFLDADVILSPS